MQAKYLSINRVITKLESLSIFLQEEKESDVDETIQMVLDKAAEFDIPVEKTVTEKK